MRTGEWVASLTAVAAVLWLSGAAMAAHSDTMGCGNCHVPHKAVQPDATTYGVPLWSPVATSDGLPTFTVYTSPTFDALSTGISQPDGPSKLCLGCHDGSFADVTAEHSFGSGGALTLTESHPVSFVYDTALTTNPKLPHPGELRDPATATSGLTAAGTIATDLLDANSKMQCTSCHDVHVSGKTHALRWSTYDTDRGLQMCTTCHNK